MPLIYPNQIKPCPCGCGKPCKVFYWPNGWVRFYSRRGIGCPTTEKGRHSKAGKGHYGPDNKIWRPIGSTRIERKANHPYRIVKTAEGKWEYEHRVVMERVLGRKLTRKEVVHHYGDTLDNRPENLLVTNTADHIRGHFAVMGWARSGATCCAECGRNDRPHQAHDLCRACWQRYLRRKRGYWSKKRHLKKSHPLPQDPQP